MKKIILFILLSILAISSSFACDKHKSTQNESTKESAQEQNDKSDT